jgi:hypothetical protein
MTAFSRRAFVSNLAASFPAIFLSRNKLGAIPASDEKPPIPQTIAGHELSADEKALVAKFSASQDKDLSPLRTRDLPNSLPPTFVVPAPPVATRESRR